MVFGLRGGKALAFLERADPDETGSDSHFYTSSRRAADALVQSVRRDVSRQIKEFRETEPGQRRFRGRAWWNSGGSGGDRAATGSKVQASVADCAGRGKAGKVRVRGHGKGTQAGGGGVVPSPTK